MSQSTYWHHVPGESVYGLVVNYHVGRAHHSWRQTNLELFGRTHVRLHPVLPSCLNVLAKHFGLNPVHLLNTATGYPLYALSLGEKSSELANSLCSSNGKIMSSKSCQAAFSLPFDKVFKYCQSCVDSSYEQHGKLLWLTVHQLYGVSYCSKHGEILKALHAGEGGINRRYELPRDGGFILNAHNEKALYLSAFISKLHHFLGQNNSLRNLDEYYKEWLHRKEFMTSGGKVRLKPLTKELVLFWRPLFESPSVVVPLELSRFNYISTIVHCRRPVHYLKHVLFMAYLARGPEQFFSEKPVVKSSLPNSPSEITSKTSKVIALLKDGISMRRISHETGVSIGSIKQLALRNNFPINKRRKTLTEDIERDIWRKAFRGFHRADIAGYHNISVAAVEQIIQSHLSLSDWRHHLLMCQRKHAHRNNLLNLMDAHPLASRNELKKMSSSYLWLYKHDREWLYERLPAAKTSRYYPALKWAARDKILALKMRNMIKPAVSLSALDRQLGGHGWLLKNSQMLPLTMAEAYQKIHLWNKR